MEVTNRALLIVTLVAAILAIVAVWLSTQLDGQIGAMPLVGHVAGQQSAPTMHPYVKRSGKSELIFDGPLYVTASDSAIAHVTMECEGFKARQRFERDLGRTVAFIDLPAGAGCAVILDGADEPYSPVHAGDRIDCKALEQKTVCTGGAANKHAGQLSVSASQAATLMIDGVDRGELPFGGSSGRGAVPFGKHQLELRDSSGASLVSWTLHISPDEHVEVLFDHLGGQHPATDSTPGAAPAPQAAIPTVGLAEPEQQAPEPDVAIPEPTDEAAVPTEEAAEPTEEAAEPTEGAAEPTEGAAEPTEGAAEPTDAPPEPINEAPEPTGEPTEGAAEPTADGAAPSAPSVAADEGQ